MRVRYIGSGENPPFETNAFGIDFVLGRWVEVLDPFACRKFEKHQCFEVAPGDEIEDAEFEEMPAPKRRGRPPKVEVLNGNISRSEEESGL